jgi:formamidopyrimidine-DNA glycosylase
MFLLTISGSLRYLSLYSIGYSRQRRLLMFDVHGLKHGFCFLGHSSSVLRTTADKSGRMPRQQVASLEPILKHLLSGEESLRSMDPGGIDLLTSDLESFRSALSAENRTLKRALTDPRLVSGIGNAYSDEILHAAKLSPVTLTHKLRPNEWQLLFTSARHTLEQWVDRLQTEAGTGFPEKVTAFHKGMAVHGRYGEPCPRCGEKVLRIRYADNETNYCARCQTSGKVLADRSLSRLLGSEWPRTLEELEALKRR